MGLMLGVELVRDRASKEPASTETAEVLELCKDRGLLIGKGGLSGNVLRIKPPMCLTRDDADFLVDCLDEVLSIGRDRDERACGSVVRVGPIPHNRRPVHRRSTTRARASPCPTPAGMPSPRS